MRRFDFAKLPLRNFWFAAGSLALIFAPGIARAQEQPTGTTNAAIAAMHDGIVDAARGQVLEGGGGNVSQGGTSVPGVFATTRSRLTDRDEAPWTNSGGPPFGAGYATEATEFSVIGSVYWTFNASPSVRTQVGLLGGYGEVDLDFQTGPVNIDPLINASGASAENWFYGGYVLVSQSSYYAMVTVTGTSGDARVVDLSPNFGGSASYDTSGVLATLDVGSTFTIAQSASGSTYLDVRGGLGALYFSGDTFIQPNDATQFISTDLDATYAGISLELFAPFTLAGGTTITPFVKGTYRHFITYDNEVNFETLNTVSEIAEGRDKGLVEAGMKYTAIPDKAIITGSIYYEGDSYQDTIGGRLGASVKLD